MSKPGSAVTKRSADESDERSAKKSKTSGSLFGSAARQGLKKFQQKSVSAPKPSTVDKLKARLAGSRFRSLNQTLYESDSASAFRIMKKEPELLKIYHEGFASQVSQWPINPLTLIIQKVKQLPKTAVIADFGCGDAALAAAVPHKTHSFDLVALNPRITAANTKSVPLPPTSVDAAVFCLSLMGTDFMDSVKEAHRVLKPNGKLLVAEVTSRFEGFDSFKGALKDLGFDCVKEDSNNTHFVLFDFVKSTRPSTKPRACVLKACVYKRR